MASDSSSSPSELTERIAALEQELQVAREREAAAQVHNQQLRKLLDLCDHERRLFAHEIHDGIVQDLTGSLLFLDASLYRFGKGAEQPDQQALASIREDLVKTTGLLRGAIVEARRLMSGLKPPRLQEQGLESAIERLAEDLHSTYGMDIELKFQLPSESLLSTIEIAIFRVIQESLSNVRRHSGTLRARVTACVEDGVIVATISDDGEGFQYSSASQPATHSGGHGLAGIRERAEMVGGQVEIDSEPGRGTTVKVRFPLVLNATRDSHG